jgi:hypothetical protein
VAWVIAVQKAGSGLVRLVREGETIAHDDRSYGDVHIAPCAEIGNRFDFGAHEFKRTCYCRPEVRIEDGQRTMVIHQERKVT